MTRSILLCSRALVALGAAIVAAVSAALPDDPAPATQIVQPPDGISLTLRTARENVEQRLAEMETPAERADAWGGLGMLYHAQDRLGEAAESYSRALAENPAIHWHYLLGVVHTDRGDVEAAAAAFRAALELAGGQHMLAHYRLGLVHLADGEHAAAAAALREASAQAPEAAAVLTALADAELGLGHLEAARDLLEKAAGFDASAGRIAYKLALVHRQLGDLAGAEAWLARRNDLAPAIDDPLLVEVAALNLSPKFFTDVGNRAWQRGEHDEAVAAWRRAAELAPDDVDVGLALVHALGVLDRADEASTEVERVLRAHPESARAWYLSAWIGRKSEDQAVRTALDRALRLAEDDAARALSAALWMRGRRYMAAAEDYQALAARQPENAYYRYWLAMAYLGAGSCSAARPVMAEALRLQPKWGQAHLALARADALCGDSDTRAAAAAKARRLVDVEDNADTRITLAWTALAVGNPDEARSIIAADAGHPDAAMLHAAIAEHGADAIRTLARPFADDSPWWRPEELR